MTEKQQEFQTNLVQFLTNIGRPVQLEEIIPIYHVTFSRRRPRHNYEHIANLLGHLESDGVITCEWVISRDTDVVRSVTLARSVGIAQTQQQSSH